MTSRPPNDSRFTWDTEHSKKIAFTEGRAFRRMLLRAIALRAHARYCVRNHARPINFRYTQARSLGS